MVTRQSIYARIENLRKGGRDISAESHGDPRRMYIYTADHSRLLIGGLTPGEANIWLDGYVDGLWANRQAQDV